MQWHEAYKRVAIAVASGIIIYIGGIIVVAIGYWIATSDNILFTVLGILVAAVGFLFLILGMVAVWLKVITDSIVDHVKKDLTDQIESLRQEIAPSNKPTEDAQQSDVESPITQFPRGRRGVKRPHQSDAETPLMQFLRGRRATKDDQQPAAETSVE